MLRRLRQRVVRLRRVILALALVAFAAPAVAGPLAYCLNSGDPPRIVAAASHCESMTQTIVDPSANKTVLPHLPMVDEAVGTGAGTVVVPTVVQSVVLFMHVGGLLPPLSVSRPSRDDAYGGAPPERSSMSGPAGVVVGRAARLLI